MFHHFRKTGDFSRFIGLNVIKLCIELRKTKHRLSKVNCCINGKLLGFDFTNSTQGVNFDKLGHFINKDMYIISKIYKNSTAI